MKRRTDTRPTPAESPKGYGFICFDCAVLADMGDEYNIMVTQLRYGTCDVCKAEDVGRLSVELARHAALVERAEKDGQTTEG